MTKILDLFQKNISRIFKEHRSVASRSGYLLLELLIAMTLFSIIVLIATGSFVNILKTQRQVVALSAAQSNLGIVMEEMAREIRTGSLFCTKIDGTPDPTCGCSIFGSSTVCSALTFSDSEGNNIEYSLNGANGFLEKTVSSTAEEITGADVKVQYLKFILFGNIPGDHWNPRVTATLGILPSEASLSGNLLNLETTVSARQIDCVPNSSPSSC
jgi:type II secretory pathway pseudopilin PulG